jgi:hypothetical protein
MPMHLNSLTPMRISGTPRSFLNLDSRCLTSIEAVVVGGDLDSPLPTLRVGLVSMNMLSPLSVVARRPPASEGGMRLGGLETSLHPNLLDHPPQPAEAPGAFEERGRQALARLMASAAMNGGAPLPLPFPTIGGSCGFRYRWIMVRQHLKHVRQLQVAARYARSGRWAPGNKLVHG